MKIYGKSELKDYITLYFSYHYIFKSKQSFMTRILVISMVIMNFVFKFINSYKNVQSGELNQYISYLITDTLIFCFYLLIIFVILTFAHIIFIYNHYKKLYKDSNYTEINDDSIILSGSTLNLSISMQDIIAVVQVKQGCLFEFKNLAVLYIPFRFFENKDIAINLFESIRNKYLSTNSKKEECNAQIS